jgi:hypothetical protein
MLMIVLMNKEKVFIYHFNNVKKIKYKNNYNFCLGRLLLW